MTTTIPCKRPGVPVVEGPKGAVSYCNITGCDWTYGPGVKTDVKENATRHRQEHRDAVPRTEVVHLGDDFGYQARCECDWTSAPGTVTRADCDTSLAYHLDHDHGLVTG